MKKLIVIVILGLLLTGCADIHAYDAQLAEKDATIAKLQNELLSKDAEIADMEALITELQSKYDQLKEAQQTPKDFVYYNDLVSFLERDQTDKIPYIEPDFVCIHYAITLVQNAYKEGKMLYILVYGDNDHSGDHAICFARMGNRSYYIEPQTDQIMMSYK